ncbi:MAG: periplasmic heavy metal sensor [Steroidobacteraceae bacterium]
MDNLSDKRRWSRWALPASLILNLFLVALIGGHVLRNRAADRHRPTPLAMALVEAGSRLSPGDASAFLDVVRHDAPLHADAVQRLTAARDQVEQQIVREPFDPQATKQALAAWRVNLDRFLEEFSDTLVDGLGKVSPAGRRQLVAGRREAAGRPP